LRILFAPKRDEITGGWRKLHHEKHDEKINAYRILVGKPEGKRPLEKPRRW
jgi:hypothetical protein